jgi:hypothetical protein
VNPLIDFATQLLIGTHQGRVRWQTTDDPVRFIATGETGAIRIGPVDLSSPVALELLDKHGDIIESLSTDPERPGPWRDWETTLMELAQAARLDASGAISVLDGLRQEWKLPQTSADDDIPF